MFDFCEWLGKITMFNATFLAVNVGTGWPALVLHLIMEEVCNCRVKQGVRLSSASLSQRQFARDLWRLCGWSWKLVCFIGDQNALTKINHRRMTCLTGVQRAVPEFDFWLYSDFFKVDFDGLFWGWLGLKDQFPPINHRCSCRGFNFNANSVLLDVLNSHVVGVVLGTGQPWLRSHGSLHLHASTTSSSSSLGLTKGVKAGSPWAVMGPGMMASLPLLLLFLLLLSHSLALQLCTDSSGHPSNPVHVIFFIAECLFIWCSTHVTVSSAVNLWFLSGAYDPESSFILLCLQW